MRSKPSPMAGIQMGIRTREVTEFKRWLTSSNVFYALYTKNAFNSFCKARNAFCCLSQFMLHLLCLTGKLVYENRILTVIGAARREGKGKSKEHM